MTKAPRYYGPDYDSAVLHPADGTHSSGPTRTLEGQLQVRLDGLHITLAQHGPNDPPMTGTVLEQSTRAAVKRDLFETSRTYPKMYLDAVPAGKTADGLAWYYWNQARAIFSYYGR